MKVEKLKKILAKHNDTDEVEIIFRDFTEHPGTTVSLRIKTTEIKLNKRSSENT